MLRYLCLTASLAIFLLAGSASATESKIVGYYTAWSMYVRDYHVYDISAEQVDAINYAFANISGGQIALGDPCSDSVECFTECRFNSSD